nr:unnamed protein product [Trypanosoma congolense IL3000]
MTGSLIRDIEETRRFVEEWYLLCIMRLRNARTAVDRHFNCLENLLNESVSSPRHDDNKFVDSLMVTPSRPTATVEDKSHCTPSMASPPVSRATLNYDRLLDEVDAVARIGSNISQDVLSIWQGGGVGDDVLGELSHKRPTPELIPEDKRNCPPPTNSASPCQVVVMFKRMRILQFESPTYVAPGEYVVVGGDRGEDIGLVTQSWVLDERDSNGEKKWAEGVGRVLRVASTLEISQLQGVQTELEDRAVEVAQKKVEEHGLPMCIVDAEYQFDRKKLTFYYRSHQRLDFRVLVRDLYKTFRARIWMEPDTPPQLS